MVSLQISITEEGALKVAQRADLRVLLGRLQREGGERHLVSTWPHCDWASRGVPEAAFNRILQTLFVLLLLTVPVVNVIISGLVFAPSWGHIWDQLWLSGRRGLVPLVLFAASVAIGLLVKRVMKRSCSASPRTENVISAVVQQV